MYNNRNFFHGGSNKLILKASSNEQANALALSLPIKSLYDKTTTVVVASDAFARQ